MSNPASERSSPKSLPSVFTVIDQRGKSPKQGGLLLELRTEDGPVYVRPSAWQRMRLRRAFRYFHVVPPQLLSRGQQRLIEKLLRTAVVAPEGTVPDRAVFGVVQKVHAKSLLEEPPPPAIVSPVRPPAIQILPRARKKKEDKKPPSLPAAFVVQEPGMWPWIVSGAAAAAFIPLIMASVYGVSLLSSTPEAQNPHTAARAIQQLVKQRSGEFQAQASAAVPALPAGNLPAVVPLRKRRTAADSPRPATQDPGTTPAESTARPQTRFVSELPPGHFAHPVVATRNLVGEVRLKALIGADGSVKQVTVLSGNPKLAQAAMQAVMRWHYSPYEVLGDPVAVETEVKMSFFGPDAVSIASVADRLSSQIK